MVNNLRIAEAAMGDCSKSVLKSEEPARQNARRSIVITENLKKGTVLKKSHLTAKRPSTGISPNKVDELIGLTLSRDVNADEVLMPNDIEEDATFKRILPHLLDGKSQI